MSTGTGLRFSTRELVDLVVAWVALGVAFTIFFAGGGQGFLRTLLGGGSVDLLVVSLLTAGVGFLFHELAHKVVAVRFGQVAEFRADYGMLFVALMSALVGFLFAAPGAVHHRGYLTEREHGLIALAGPAINVVLTLVFGAVLLGAGVVGSSFLGMVGVYGVLVNLFLAGFNMIPFGSLDGKTVFGWSKLVWAGFLAPVVLAGVAVWGLLTGSGLGLF